VEIERSEFTVLQMPFQPSDSSRLPFEIDRASWRDLNTLRQIEKVCFPQDAWPVLDLIGVLTLPNIVRLKALQNDRVVGFIAGDVRSAEQVAWIATICVLPEYRRKGIGAALLEHCEKLLNVPQIKLCVRLSNHAAIRLYEEFGYSRSNIWPRYYTNGEDAAVMEKRLQ
jgi:ribosomal protein S18 acetylase RimI-like enzyme